MRYQNFFSFQKHLSNAAPNHLCKVYLVAAANDFERSKIISQIGSYFSRPLKRFQASECQILDTIFSMDLFDSPIILLDEVEKLTKKQVGLIIHNLKSAGELILGSRSCLSALFDAVEKEGVVLDLLGEKPWDREKRLVQEIIQEASHAKKRLNEDVAHFLLQRVGPDLALLESEIQKAICYIGDREVITQEVIISISQATRTSSLWQIAEEAVWERRAFGSLDSSSFHALIPALRNQLHIGLTLASLIEEKRPSDQWSRFLPKLFPKTLEKRTSQAARLGSSYFQNGLKALFEIELLSRTQSSRLEALLDLYQSQQITSYLSSVKAADKSNKKDGASIKKYNPIFFV